MVKCVKGESYSASVVVVNWWRSIFQIFWTQPIWMLELLLRNEEPTLFCNDSVMLMHNTRSCSIDFQWLKKSKNDQPCPLGFCSNAVSCPIPNKLCHKQNVIVFTIFTSKWKVVLSSFFSADLSHGRHHISHFLWLVLCTHKTSLVSSFLSLLPCSILHRVSENHRHISYHISIHDSYITFAF